MVVLNWVRGDCKGLHQLMCAHGEVCAGFLYTTRRLESVWVTSVEGCSWADGVPYDALRAGPCLH